MADKFTVFARWPLVRVEKFEETLNTDKISFSRVPEKGGFMYYFEILDKEKVTKIINTLE